MSKKYLMSDAGFPGAVIGNLLAETAHRQTGNCTGSGTALQFQRPGIPCSPWPGVDFRKGDYV